MKQREIRDHKFKILYSYEYNKDCDIDIVIDKYFQNFPYEAEDDENTYVCLNENINDNDKNYIKEQIKLIISKLNDVDKILKENIIRWDIERIGRCELTILRLAIFEIFEDKLNVNIAINEAVLLSKTYGDSKANTFINGILASIIKK